MVLAHNIEDTARTNDVRISHNVTFDSLLLAAGTLLGLKNSGFYKPSPIQLHGIPLGKCGFDLLLEAKSGTGKTAVFTVIALEKLDIFKGLQAVILAPTREIAAQICDVIKQIGSSHSGLTVEVVMGGLPIKDDIAKFQKKKAHIVVGSPGRLRQLIQEKHINVSTVRLLVLDEADKLLTKSFLPDINYMFSVLPKEKQIIMSSATYTEETKKFIMNYVQSAQHVCPDSNSILLGITQKVTTVKHNSNIVKQTKLRFDELLKILSKHSFKQCLIFCNYQARIAELHKMLKKDKWPAQQLYGQQEQLDRLDALKSLQEYKCRILISTDLAARGIDASNVDLVINFEPPFEWQTYLHRIGRTGRFGSYGLAITILSEGQEQNKFIKIVQDIKAPLNLTNLWSEENFIKDDDESTETGFSNTPSVAETIELKCDFLWKALTRDNKVEAPEKKKNDENQGDIESFDDLCNAFNNPNIESFSDLISSLAAYQASEFTLDPPVPSLQWIKVPVTYIPVEEKSMNGKLPNDDINNSYMNEDSNNNQTQKEKVKDKIVYQQHINGATRCNNALQNFTNKEEDYTSDDEYTELEQALINAGLPTAFGSSKYTKPENYKICKSTSTKQQNNHEKEESHDLCKDAKQITQKSDCSLNTGPSTATKSSKRDTDDDVKCNYSKSTKDMYHNNMKQPNVHKWKEEKSEKSANSDYEPFVAYNDRNNIFNHNRAENYSSQNEKEDSDDYSYNSLSYQYANLYGSKTSKPTSVKKNKHSHCSRSRNSNEAYATYVNWYNNLKFRMKQVELAVYYEEMAKLYSN